MTIISNVNSVTLNASTYANNKTIREVNLSNVPWVNNSMTGAFLQCTNLTSISNINRNVENMEGTFVECSNLVNAPVIPNSVTDMSGTFAGCSNLVNAPVIPNGITNMDFTFSRCDSLVNAPVIPNGITNMYRTFDGCTNLTGNIYIETENITNAQICFSGTALDKNVYIPFNYANGKSTYTYDAFTQAGYGTDSNNRVNGVCLFDINSL